MSARRGIWLTGATGLLGRYLLRDLLAAGHRVAVLVRDSRRASAVERIRELLAFGRETLGRPLPSPVVLAGDLGTPRLGLSLADRQWLRRHCQAVLHAAADLSFRSTPVGEPWRTNVDGTQALLEVSRQLGLSEWHHVSTAYVCGKRRGPVAEDDLDCGQEFHNPYEQSKFEAECRLRRTRGFRTTIYRPAILVGDSRTGYTSSYAGFYRLPELAARLADHHPATGPRRLPLRLPLTGDETDNLVPVDWATRALVALVARPEWHGRTFHLVASTPVSARLVLEVAAEELGVEGVTFAGPGDLPEPSRLEQVFWEGIQDYRPYLADHPQFLRANTAAALPHLPAPDVDGPMLRRLIRFAVADAWGRSHRRRRQTAPGGACASLCAHYIEQVFPQQARQWRLAQGVGLHLRIAFHIHGPGGGQWSCQWTHGKLTSVRRGLDERAEVTYETDAATFEAVVRRRQTPQEAFFAHQVAIRGDLETALKLAVLFDQFLRDHPYPDPSQPEVLDAAFSRV